MRARAFPVFSRGRGRLDDDSLLHSTSRSVRLFSDDTTCLHRRTESPAPPRTTPGGRRTLAPACSGHISRRAALTGAGAVHVAQKSKGMAGDASGGVPRRQSAIAGACRLCHCERNADVSRLPVAPGCLIALPVCSPAAPPSEHSVSPAPPGGCYRKVVTAEWRLLVVVNARGAQWREIV